MDLHPTEEHHLLVFWVGLFVVLITAKALGALARRVGQPAVVGELAAGVLLGPSLLGRVAPDVSDWMFPADDVQTAMLFTVGWIGVVLLLVVTGEETDLGLIRRLGRSVTIVSIGSLVVPLGAGLAIGLLLPEMFLGAGIDRSVFALFLAAALSISSLPVIAKILGDMGFMRRNFGQMTLAAGMANDVVGWVLLGVVAGLAQAGTIDLGAVASTLLGLAVFFAVAFTIGQRALDAALARLRLAGARPGAATGVLVMAALGAGAITQWLGVEAVLGAFVAGVLIGRSRFRDRRAIEPIEVATSTFFAPVFFATAGLRVDLGLLTDPEVLVWGLGVLGVAGISKFVGAMVGARLTGLSTREGAALGIGLNARGALEIVIATVGISLGVLNQASYTVIVLMAITTSMAAPPLLRRALAGWAGTDEERERLAREEMLAGNVLVRNEAVLVPTRGRENSVMSVQIASMVWPDEVPITLATADRHGRRADTRVLRSVLYGRPVEERLLPAQFEVDAILTELRLGYGAVVVGANHQAAGRLLSPFVETLAHRSPVPVVVVRRGRSVVGRQPEAYSRVLLPVAGTPSARAAQELGLNVSAAIGTEAVLAHVVDRVPVLTPAAVPASGRRQGATHANEAAAALLERATKRAREIGARSSPILVTAASAADGILETVAQQQADLVVLGAKRRDLDGRLFLGHTVERVLAECDATVVVVVTPNGSTV